MSAPNRPSPVNPSTVAPIPSPAEERKLLLALDSFLLDSGAKNPRSYLEKWNADRDYRLAHAELSEIQDALARFFRRDARLSPAKLKSLLDGWLNRPGFADDPLNAIFLKNMRGVLAQFQTPDNAARAAEVRDLLPPEPAPVSPPAENPSDASLLPPRRLVLGAEFANDTVPVALTDFAGLPISILAIEQSKFTLKGSAEFPAGPWIGMVRVGGGTFTARNIPGSGDDFGSGWRAGADFALVDPYAKSHDRAGGGLELTGIYDHGGEASGVPTPPPVVRLHLFRESDISFRIGDKMELGFNTFLNNQDSYWILGNDTSQIPGHPDSPLSTSGTLFAANPFRLFSLSARYYLEGSPGRETASDHNRPFRPGEAGPKLGQLWAGQLINFNRRGTVPAFANSEVLLGVFWPQGMEASRTQFKTIATGLTLFSLQDGWGIAGNARLRGELWRREQGWLHKGLMLGTDAVWMGYHLFRVATAKDDPPGNQTQEEFDAAPGSVRDFRGRTAKLSMVLGGWELGLSALDASGQAGNVADADRTRYNAVSWAALGIGLAGVLFSAPLSGNPCLDSGQLLRCGFPGNEEKYFHNGIHAGPGDMRAIEKQYMVSTAAASLLGWGVSRLLQPLLLDKPGKDGPAGGKSNHSLGVSQPYLQLNAGAEGAQVVFGGLF